MSSSRDRKGGQGQDGRRGRDRDPPPVIVYSNPADRPPLIVSSNPGERSRRAGEEEAAREAPGRRATQQGASQGGRSQPATVPSDRHRGHAVAQQQLSMQGATRPVLQARNPLEHRPTDFEVPAVQSVYGPPYALTYGQPHFPHPAAQPAFQQPYGFMYHQPQVPSLGPGGHSPHIQTNYPMSSRLRNVPAEDSSVWRAPPGVYQTEWGKETYYKSASGSRNREDENAESEGEDGGTDGDSEQDDDEDGETDGDSEQDDDEEINETKSVDRGRTGGTGAGKGRAQLSSDPTRPRHQVADPEASSSVSTMQQRDTSSSPESIRERYRSLSADRERMLFMAGPSDPKGGITVALGPRTGGAPTEKGKGVETMSSTPASAERLGSHSDSPRKERSPPRALSAEQAGMWPPLGAGMQDVLHHMFETQQRMEGIPGYVPVPVTQILAERHAKMEKFGALMAKGDRPTIHYTVMKWPVQVWSWTSKPPLQEYAQELNTRKKRQEKLYMALQTHSSHRDIVLLADEDRSTCEASKQPTRSDDRTEAIYQHSEFIDFENRKAGGLIVHGNEPAAAYSKGQTSVMSASLNQFYERAMGRRSIVLTHAAGICKYDHKHHHDHMNGGSGLIRSLAAQFIVQIEEKFENKQPLSLTYVNPTILEGIRKRDMRTACSLFRELLCDLATWLVKDFGDWQEIVVIVDGIDALDQDTLISVVGFFRTLCDEIECTELGKRIRFRYLLIHPLKCALPPYPVERNIIFNSSPHKQGSGSADLSQMGEPDDSATLAADPGLGEEYIFDEESASFHLPDQASHMLRSRQIANANLNLDAIEDMGNKFSEMVTNLQAEKIRYARKRREDPSPLMDYPVNTIKGEVVNRSVQLWSPQLAMPNEYEKMLKTPYKRHQELQDAIQIRPNMPKLLDVTNADRKACFGMISDHRALISRVDQHAEVARLGHLRAGGLVIHCDEDGYEPKSCRSALSGFLGYKHKQINKAGGMVLTYAAGLRSALKHGDRSILTGTPGCLRQLCMQLIAYDRNWGTTQVGTTLPLRFLTTVERLQEFRRWNIGPLLLVFRDMMVDIAKTMSDKAKPTKVRIVVIVDCIDWLESGEEPQKFQLMIYFFRTLCNEIEFGELGNYVSFTYILIHPQTSVLATTPHPLERNLFMHDVIDPQTLVALDAVEQGLDTGTPGDKGKYKSPREGRKGGRPKKSGKETKEGQSSGKPQAPEEAPPSEQPTSHPRVDSESVERAMQEKIRHMAYVQRKVQTALFPEQSLGDQVDMASGTMDRWRRKTAEYEGEAGSTTPPTINYPELRENGEIEELALAVWSPHAKLPAAGPYKREFQTPQQRRAQICTALQTRRDQPTPQKEWIKDRDICKDLRNKPSPGKKTFEKINDCVEVSQFNNIRAGGLVIHANDANHVKKAHTTPLAPFLALKHGLVEQDKNSIAISCVVGRCHDPSRVGATDCVRQFCLQLINSKLGLELLQFRDYTSKEDVQMFKEHKITEMLCVFRDLITELAHGIRDSANHSTGRIVAIIDGIDWIETNPAFEVMIQFFRTLCDESEFADLGKYVNFTYILLHPKIGEIGTHTHPLERHLFLDKELHPKDILISSSAPTGSDKRDPGNGGKDRTPGGGRGEGGGKKRQESRSKGKASERSGGHVGPGSFTRNSPKGHHNPPADSGNEDSDQGEEDKEPAAGDPGDGGGGKMAKKGARDVLSGAQVRQAAPVMRELPDWANMQPTSKTKVDLAKNQIRLYLVTQGREIVTMAQRRKKEAEYQNAIDIEIGVRKLKIDNNFQRNVVAMISLPFQSVDQPRGYDVSAYSERHENIEAQTYPEDLKNARLRNRALRQALDLGHEPTVREIAQRDRQYYEQNYENDGKKLTYTRLAQLIPNPDLVWWWHRPVSGLIIHANDPRYPGADGARLLSGFMSMLARKVEEGPYNLAITHASRSNLNGNPNIAGADGALRSVCSQLLRHPAFPEKQKTDRKKSKSGEKATRSINEPELFFLQQTEHLEDIKELVQGSATYLFRELIHEIADRLRKLNWGRSRIVVIIDDFDVVENDKTYNPNELLIMLRTVCEEVQVSDLIKWIDFQYVLINPQYSSSVAKDLNDLEYHIIM